MRFADELCEWILVWKVLLVDDQESAGWRTSIWDQHVFDDSSGSEVWASALSRCTVYLKDQLLVSLCDDRCARWPWSPSLDCILRNWSNVGWSPGCESFQRETSPFLVLTSRWNCRRYFSSVRTCFTWNSLLEWIVNLPDRRSFKLALEHHIRNGNMEEHQHWSILHITTRSYCIHNTSAPWFLWSTMFFRQLKLRTSKLGWSSTSNAYLICSWCPKMN